MLAHEALRKGDIQTLVRLFLDTEIACSLSLSCCSVIDIVIVVSNWLNRIKLWLDNWVEWNTLKDIISPLQFICYVSSNSVKQHFDYWSLPVKFEQPWIEQHSKNAGRDSQRRLVVLPGAKLLKLMYCLFVHLSVSPFTETFFDKNMFIYCSKLYEVIYKINKVGND